MTAYAYVKTEHGDLVECNTCGSPAPVAEFTISDIPTRFAREKAGESTKHWICEVCASTHCGTILGSSSHSSADHWATARMIAQATNLVLDKLLKRRPPP